MKSRFMNDSPGRYKKASLPVDQKETDPYSLIVGALAYL